MDKDDGKVKQWKSPEWIKCPRCGSSSMHYRVTKRNYICKFCGTVYAADWDEQRVWIAEDVFGEIPK